MIKGCLYLNADRDKSVDDNTDRYTFINNWTNWRVRNGTRSLKRQALHSNLSVRSAEASTRTHRWSKAVMTTSTAPPATAPAPTPTPSPAACRVCQQQINEWHSSHRAHTCR